MDGAVFIGRSGELDVLAGLVAAVTDGAGGVVLVEGEQGIGKSALLRAGLAKADEAGTRVGWAAGDEVTQGLPLRLMAECVDSADPDGVTGAAAGSGPGRGFGVLAGDPVLARAEELLEAVDRLCGISPVVLVAEDLQWADEASLVVWQRLCRVVRQLPLLLAGSCRPGPGGPRRLDRLRTGVVAAGGAVLRLGALDQSEVAELVGSLAGGEPGSTLIAVTARAGGNPLYARELVEALVRDGRVRDGRVRVVAGVAELAADGGAVGVPDSLAAAVRRRLAGLGAEAERALRWAAVLGTEFSLGNLAVVTGRRAGDLAEAVDEAVAGQVVAEAGPRLAFRHGLIRQVLYESMPVTTRVELHRQAARALAGAGVAAERVAAQLMTALEQGGDAADVVDEWLVGWLAGVAGDVVYRAPGVAAELLRAVVGRLPLTDPRREDMEAALVTAAFLLMRGDEVEQVGGRLLAGALDPDRHAEVAWLVGSTLLRSGRAAASAAVAETAMNRAGVDLAWAARLRALLTEALNGTGEVDRAARTAAQALATAEQAGDRLAAGYALNALAGVSLFLRDQPGRLSYTDRALAVIGDDPQATGLRVALLAERSSVLADLDRREEAVATARQGLALAERAGSPKAGAIRIYLAHVHYEAGHWDDALAEAEPAIDLPQTRVMHAMLHALLALIAGHRDDQDTAASHLSVLADQTKRAGPLWQSAHYALLAQALAAERAGRPGEAAAVLAPCLRPSIAEQMPGRFVLLPWLARLALATGDHTAATAATAAATEEADREHLPLSSAVAGHCHGLLAGDPAPVLAAASYFQSAGRPADQALALEDAAELAAVRGDTKQARQAFGAAVQLYLALGAVWDIRRAQTRLRPFGLQRARGTYRPRPDSGWAALTPTEVTIARLVGAGLSNPDIAAELFLSRRTVQTHISHILRKLDHHSRAQIAVAASQHLTAR